MGWRLGLQAVDWLRARAIGLVYPPHCAWCALPCPDADRLCPGCREQFSDRFPACPLCGVTLAGSALADTAHVRPQCPHCAARRPPFQATVRLAPYDGLLRQAVLRLKRAKDPALGMALAHLLFDQCEQRLTALAADVVVPMPMHWTRRVWRGVNSPSVLAQTLARRLRLPCAPHLLRMRRRTRPQTGLTGPNAPGQRARGLSSTAPSRSGRLTRAADRRRHDHRRHGRRGHPGTAQGRGRRSRRCRAGPGPRAWLIALGDAGRLPQPAPVGDNGPVACCHFRPPITACPPVATFASAHEPARWPCGRPNGSSTN